MVVPDPLEQCQNAVYPPRAGPASKRNRPRSQGARHGPRIRLQDVQIARPIDRLERRPALGTPWLRQTTKAVAALRAERTVGVELPLQAASGSKRDDGRHEQRDGERCVDSGVNLAPPASATEFSGTGRRGRSQDRRGERREYSGRLPE